MLVFPIILSLMILTDSWFSATLGWILASVPGCAARPWALESNRFGVETGILYAERIFLCPAAAVKSS